MFRFSTSALIILVISGIIMFYNLGGIPLLDPDEPVYAETPKEMYTFNEFISPRIYGEYWYDKPPMYYWLVAASYKIFGVTEFAARFPSALLGVLCVLAVYIFARRFFGGKAGLTSALVLATSIEYFYLGKAAVTDITLNLFLTLCLLSFIDKRYYWAYFWAGLATVTKGPIGLIFPGAIVFLYLAVTGNFSELKKMKIPTGIALFSLVAIPWYWIMFQIHGTIFIDTFLGFHNITRFTSPEHPELVVWYYYIPVLLLGFFPWTALGVQAVWASLTKGSRERNVLLFLNVWAAFIFLFFTVSRTKLVSYILPMFPPLAMIVGWYIDYLWSGRKKTCPSWPILLTILVLFLVGGMFLGLKAMPELASGVIAQSVILVIMAVAVVYLTWRKSFQQAFWMQVIAMTLFSMVLMTVLFPIAAPAFTVKNIANDFRANYDGVSPVYVVKFLHPGFTFYTDIYGNEILTDEDLIDTINNNKKAYILIRQLEYKKLSNNDLQKVSILATSADKVLLLKQ